MDNKEDRRIYTFSKEEPVKAVLKMSIPLVAGMFIMVLYNLVDTQQYVRIILLGSFFTMGSYTIGALLRSEGSVRYSMTGMLVGTVTNVILDPLLIFTLNMQIKGAAIATVLGNVVGFGVSVLYYLSGKTLLRPSIKKAVPSARILKEIYWVGVPASFETLLTSAAYMVNNNLAVAYGELTVAAMGIAQKVLSLGSYVYQGFASGTQPIMGYNFGAGNTRRMKAVSLALLLGVIKKQKILPDKQGFSYRYTNLQYMEA